MPKQQQQYQGALDSIYNVIFAQAQKPPQKKKGGDWTKGIPGDPLSYAVTDMLAKPWMFWGNAVKEVADELHGNVKLTNFWNFGMGFTDVYKSNIGEQKGGRFKTIDTRTGSARLKARDVLSKKFWSNPVGFWEKTVTEAYEAYRSERKKYALTGLIGGAADAMLVGYGYAKKIGLKGNEAWNYAMASGYFTEGANYYTRRLKLKAENVALSLDRAHVTSVAQAETYSRIIAQSLKEADLGGYYTADSVSIPPAKIVNFRTALKANLVSAGIAAPKALLDDITAKYEHEMGIYKSVLSEDPLAASREAKIPSDEKIFDVPFTPGALRETIIRNREKKIILLREELAATNPANTVRVDRLKREIELNVLQREFSDALQRIKGDNDDYSFNFDVALQRVENIYSSVADPVLRAQVSTLLGDIGREKGKIMRKRYGNNYRFSKMAGMEYSAGAGSWRDPIASFPTNITQKHAREAYKKELEAKVLLLRDRINTERGLATPNERAINILEAEIAGELSTISRIKDIRGVGARAFMGNMLASYNYVKALTSGKIFTVAGFLRGTAFWDNGIYSPGSRANLNWWDNSKLSNSKSYNIVMPREKSEIGYLRFLTDLYYVRPGSIMNTLFFNGEGYAYMALRRKEKLLGKMTKVIGSRFFAGDMSADDSVASRLLRVVRARYPLAPAYPVTDVPFIRDIESLYGFLGNNTHILLEMLGHSAGNNPLQLDGSILRDIEFLKANVIHPARLAEWTSKLKGMDKLIAMADKVNGNWFNTFIKASIKKVFGDSGVFYSAANRGIRPWLASRTYDGLLFASKLPIFSKYLKGELWEAAVKKFAFKKITAEGLISVGLRAILDGIGMGAGVAGGPPGWLVFVVTQVVFLFSDKIVKVLIKAGTGLVKGIIAIGVLAIFMVIGCGGMLSMLLDPFSDVDPNEAVSASAVGGIDEWYMHQTFYSGEEGTYEKVFRGNEQAIPAYFNNYSCIVNSPTSCGQGTGGGGSYSHSKDGGYSAIDFTPENHTMLAPADGVVTYFSPTNRCLAEGAASDANYGGHIQFKTNEGDILVMYHAKLPPGVRVGDRVSMGDPLAISQSDINSVGNPCWTGEHIHLEIKAPNNFRYNCIESWVYSKCSNFSTCLYSECN